MGGAQNTGSGAVPHFDMRARASSEQASERLGTAATTDGAPEGAGGPATGVSRVGG